MRNKLVGFALGAMLLALCVPVDAQQPERIPRIHFAKGCASLGMSKEKIFSLRTDMQKGNSTGCLTLPPNWSVSKLI